MATLTSGGLEVNATEIFDSSLGWTASYRDCKESIQNCPNDLQKVFMEKTNNFDLNAKNAQGKTLGEAFCSKFQNVAKAKLGLKIFNKCEAAGMSVIVTTNRFSQQELECANGNAKLNGSAISYSIAIYTLVSLLCMSLFFNYQF